MRKLLALLLLSPFGLTEESLTVEPTNTLDLERLSQFFPNDSYIGFTCSPNENKLQGSTEFTYRMFVLSVEEKKGINLMDVTFWSYKYYGGIRKIDIFKNEKWGQLTATDWEIKIENPGYNRLDRTTLNVRNDISCKRSSQNEMKQFGYEILKRIQDIEKEKKDELESKLNNRKL